MPLRSHNASRQLRVQAWRAGGVVIHDLPSKERVRDKLLVSLTHEREDRFQAQTRSTQPELVDMNAFALRSEEYRRREAPVAGGLPPGHAGVCERAYIRMRQYGASHVGIRADS